MVVVAPPGHGRELRDTRQQVVGERRERAAARLRARAPVLERAPPSPVGKVEEAGRIVELPAANGLLSVQPELGAGRDDIEQLAQPAGVPYGSEAAAEQPAPPLGDLELKILLPTVRGRARRPSTSSNPSYQSSLSRCPRRKSARIPCRARTSGFFRYLEPTIPRPGIWRACTANSRCGDDGGELCARHARSRCRQQHGDDDRRESWGGEQVRHLDTSTTGRASRHGCAGSPRSSPACARNSCTPACTWHSSADCRRQPPSLRPAPVRQPSAAGRSSPEKS